MTERREYDDATKAAVMAALLTGQSVSSVAREYSIPKGTVAYWKEQAVNKVEDFSTQKKQETGDLLWDYLRTSLKTLKVQAEHFGDKEWLNRQSAADLAVLHGVSVDKAIRLLEAVSNAAAAGETGG